MNILLPTHPLFKNPSKIRIILLFILVFGQTQIANSQIINNAHLSMGYGYQRHYDLSFNCHFLKYLSASIYTGETNQYVGPLYYPSKGFFSRGERLQNNYQYNGVLFGITSRTKKFYDISGMMGYSKLKTFEYTNIKKQLNTIGNDYLEYDVLKQNVNSLTFRIDFLLRVSHFFGLNFSYIKNYNSIRNEFNFMVGLNFGLVEDFKSEKWKWNQSKKI